MAALARLSIAATLTGFVLAVLSYHFGGESVLAKIVIYAVSGIYLILVLVVLARIERSPKSATGQARGEPILVGVVAAAPIVSIGLVLVFSLTSLLSGRGAAGGNPSLEAARPPVVIEPALPQIGGIVSGRPIPPSPTVQMFGAGCVGDSADLVLRPRRASTQQVRVRVELDDDSPTDAAVGLTVRVGGDVRESHVIRPRSGIAVNVADNQVPAVMLELRALSHTTNYCASHELSLHLSNLSSL